MNNILHLTSIGDEGRQSDLKQCIKLLNKEDLFTDTPGRFHKDFPHFLHHRPIKNPQKLLKQIKKVQDRMAKDRQQEMQM